MRHLTLAVAAILASNAALFAAEPRTVYLSDLDLSRMCQGMGTPQKDKSLASKPLSIGGKAFARGIEFMESLKGVNL